MEVRFPHVALFFHKKSESYQDSIVDLEKNVRLVELEKQYRTEQQSKQIIEKQHPSKCWGGRANFSKTVWTKIEANPDMHAKAHKPILYHKNLATNNGCPTSGLSNIIISESALAGYAKSYSRVSTNECGAVHVIAGALTSWFCV